MEEVMRLLRRWFYSTPSLHVEQLIIPIFIDSYCLENIRTLFYVRWRVLALAFKCIDFNYLKKQPKGKAQSEIQVIICNNN